MLILSIYILLRLYDKQNRATRSDWTPLIGTRNCLSTCRFPSPSFPFLKGMWLGWFTRPLPWGNCNRSCISHKELCKSYTTFEFCPSTIRSLHRRSSAAGGGPQSCGHSLYAVDDGWYGATHRSEEFSEITTMTFGAVHLYCRRSVRLWRPIMLIYAGPCQSMHYTRVVREGLLFAFVSNLFIHSFACFIGHRWRRPFKPSDSRKRTCVTFKHAAYLQ